MANWSEGPKTLPSPPIPLRSGSVGGGRARAGAGKLLEFPRQKLVRPITRALVEDGVSREDFARAMGRSRSWVDKVCTGEITLDSESWITLRVCKYLRCDRNYLFGRTSQRAFSGQGGVTRPLLR